MSNTVRCDVKPRAFGETGRALARTLADAGITDARWGKSKHAFVIFDIDGVRLKFPFACTPHSSSAPKLYSARLRKLIREARV